MASVKNWGSALAATTDWDTIDRAWSQPNYTWEILPLQAVTATGASSALAVPDRWNTLLLYLNCTAVSGTNPTLDVTYQVSPDFGETWITHTAFTQLTAAATQLLKITTPGKYFRLSWTIGGTDTPTVTASIDVEGSRTGGRF